MRNLFRKTINLFGSRSNGVLKLNNNKDFGEYDLVKCHKVSPERYVPKHIKKPDYFYKLQKPGSTEGDPELKNLEQIQRMRRSCKLAATILSDCEKLVNVGVTTDEIDAFVHEKIIAADAYPSPLRYAGFPKSICTSVNNVACHGIPDNRPLNDGDIINIDITVFFNGYHGDCSKTYLVGDVDEQGKFLVDATKQCLDGCIALAGPGVPFNRIGTFISEFCTKNNLGVIPAFIGHGIGSYFHGPPEILHYKNRQPGVMKQGMTFTIEPILTHGSPDIEIQEDGWTAVTTDNSRTAQFEHTILITNDGADILTTI